MFSKEKRIQELEDRIKELELSYKYELVRNEALRNAILYASYTHKISYQGQKFIYDTEQGIYESVKNAGGLD